jgi:hypothetical protein
LVLQCPNRDNRRSNRSSKASRMTDNIRSLFL